jgi:hypothetical protein
MGVEAALPSAATGYEAGPEDGNGPDTVAKIQRVYVGQAKAISGANECPFLAIFTREQMVRFRADLVTAVSRPGWSFSRYSLLFQSGPSIRGASGPLRVVSGPVIATSEDCQHRSDAPDLLDDQSLSSAQPSAEQGARGQTIPAA